MEDEQLQGKEGTRPKWLQTAIPILGALGGAMAVNFVVLFFVLPISNDELTYWLSFLVIAASVLPFYGWLTSRSPKARRAAVPLALLGFAGCLLLGCVLFTPPWEHWRTQWKLQLQPGVLRVRRYSFEDTKVTSIRFAAQGDSDVGHALPLMLDLADVEIIRLQGRRTLTDRALEDLAKLPRLRVLKLPYTGITGSGFVHLDRLTNLEEIDARYCPISDEGLKNLRKCSNLKRLDLYGPGISVEAVDGLRAALPDCDISHAAWREEDADY